MRIRLHWKSVDLGKNWSGINTLRLKRKERIQEFRPGNRISWKLKTENGYLIFQHILRNVLIFWFTDQEKWGRSKNSCFGLYICIVLYNVPKLHSIACAYPLTCKKSNILVTESFSSISIFLEGWFYIVWIIWSIWQLLKVSSVIWLQTIKGRDWKMYCRICIECKSITGI